MHFPYGDIVPAPPNFAPPEAWPEFGALAYPVALCAREAVGTHPQGVRWSLWPFTFEEYVSDTEPNLAVSKNGLLARTRIVQWKRVARTDIPPGWKAYSAKPWRIDGYRMVSGPDYFLTWDKDTRRNLRTWRTTLLGHHYAVEELTLKEFVAAYRASITFKKIGREQLLSLERKYAMPHVRPYMTLFGVRNLQTGAIIAGTAAFFVPTRSASVRECPFIHAEARSAFAMTGLMDHWFAESLKRGVTRLQFTHFWNPGEPSGWKGFSEFKSHFGLTYVAYPPVLYRLVRGKLW